MSKKEVVTKERTIEMKEISLVKGLVSILADNATIETNEDKLEAIAIILAAKEDINKRIDAKYAELISDVGGEETLVDAGEEHIFYVKDYSVSLKPEVKQKYESSFKSNSDLQENYPALCNPRQVVYQKTVAEIKRDADAVKQLEEALQAGHMSEVIIKTLKKSIKETK